MLFNLKFRFQNLDRGFDPLLLVLKFRIIQLHQQIALSDLIAGPAADLFHCAFNGRHQFVCIFREHSPFTDDRIVHIDQKHEKNRSGQHEKCTDDQPCKKADFSTETALEGGRLWR